MYKKLIKNIISFILICTLTLSMCVAFFAASDSFSDHIILARLSVDKTANGGDFYTLTWDYLNEHSCTLTEEEPAYDSLLRVKAFCHVNIGDTNQDGIIETTVIPKESSVRNETVLEYMDSVSNVDLDHIVSQHEVHLYCESRHAVRMLEAVAD